MTISIIAAMDKKGGLGLDNTLSWHLPGELKRFKELTIGHSIIMGRKTHESIGRILPDRQNIIISRNPSYKVPGGVVVGSMEEAIGFAKEEMLAGRDVFIIGGAEIYKLGIPYANKMYLTFVDAEMPADVYFPKFNEGKWQIVQTEIHEKDEKNPHGFIIKTYEKR